MTSKRKLLLIAAALLLAAGLLAVGIGSNRKNIKTTHTGFVMDTVVTHTVWGPHGEKAVRAADDALAEMEARLSLYLDTSEIAAVNAAAGSRPVTVSAQTFDLLRTALVLGEQTDGAFQLSIAPLSRLWNVMGEDPVVPQAAAVAAALPLIDDSTLVLEEKSSTAYLSQAGQALDLGGVAKGYACDVLRVLYHENGVQHALTSIGGNICAMGGNVDGTPFRIGFRDPKGGVSSYIASFLLDDGVVAVSGAYERYFERDGEIYHHILDPQTGYPAKSDIVSVGVVWPAEDGAAPGAAADLWSTTLFCWGRDRALEWMRTAPAAVLLLDDTGTLYVSESLREGFKTYTEPIRVEFIPQAE